MPFSPLTPVFDNAAGELFSHPRVYAVLRLRPAPWGVAELAALVTRLSQLLMARDWHRLLTDTRQIPVLSAECKSWMATQWMGGGLPRPVPLYQAMLHPPEVFARLAVAEVQAQAPASAHYQYFDNEAAAHAYLAQLPG